MATPTKSGMPRRFKESKHDFKIFICPGPIFFGLDFLSCPICLWSPPLGEFGNSIRGVKFCEELVKVYNFQQPKSLGFDSLNQSDPTKNKYENISEMVFNIHLAANAGDETALKW